MQFPASTTPLCPACVKPLTPIQTPNGRVFQICMDCGGRSATLAHLEEILTPLTFKRLSTQFKASRRVSDRTCPTCTSLMRHFSLEIASRAYAIEACDPCQSTWFDHREFQHLPLTAGAEEDLRLPSHVQDALNEIEVQHGRVVANRSSFRLDARDFGFGWGQDEVERPSGWKYLLGFLLIPVERENRIGRVPWVTTSLLVVTVVFSILGFSAPELVDLLGSHSNDVFRWSGLNLVTYFFVHGGWFHLLSNMYFLWLYGDNVEDEFGHLPYALALACGALGGALLHAFLDPSDQGLLIGASGGISTLGMMYSLRFPRAKLAFFLYVKWLRVPAYLLMIVWVGMQVSEASAQIEGLTRVSALAHLGGALVGLIAWALLRRS